MSQIIEERGPRITRCENCFSDMTYQFGEGGGICIQCKELITDCPYPGLSHAEFRRIKGLSESKGSQKDVANDGDKQEVVAQKKKKEIKETVDRLITVKTGLEKEVKDAEKKLKPKPKKKGVWSLIKNFFVESVHEANLRLEEDKKAREKSKTNEKPKKKDVTAKEAMAALAAGESSPSSVKGRKSEPATVRPIIEPDKPQPGERWAIGPCLSCQLPGRFTGTVLNRSNRNGKKRFVVIRRGDDAIFHGCLLCSKKA